MQTATHHPRKSPHKYAKKANSHRRRMPALMKPIKNANKRVVYYITNKPAQSIGIAALVTTFLAGIVYAKMKFFNNR
jgi:ElaB/YqjD/DUF883 family membrane-anchored ribosome-binding protein